MSVSDLVRVKPLVWEDFGDVVFVARAVLFGNIRVEQFGRDDTWIVCFSVPGYSDTLIDGEWPTPDAAKAAAQTEYEALILSALEPINPAD